MIRIVSDFKLFPIYPHFRWKSSLAFLWKSHQIFLPSNDENNFFFWKLTPFCLILSMQLALHFPYPPFYLNVLTFNWKKKWKLNLPSLTASCLGLQSHYTDVLVFFFPWWYYSWPGESETINISLVDLISLVRSHIWYLLQENSIFSNLLCQAYITHSRQSLVTNAHFYFLRSKTEFLKPTTACEYSSLFCKTVSLPLSWPWLTIQNAFCVPSWYIWVAMNTHTHMHCTHIYDWNKFHETILSLYQDVISFHTVINSVSLQSAETDWTP